MSLYEVARLCSAVNTDQDLVAALLDDPAEAIAPYDLTEWERAAFLAGDVAALHGHGVHGLLLSYLTHEPVLGLDFATYSARMREARCGGTVGHLAVARWRYFVIAATGS